MLDWLKRAGVGPTTNARIWYYYKEPADQACTQTPSPAPLSTSLPILRRTAIEQ
jgi:hypothetical protein